MLSIWSLTFVLTFRPVHSWYKISDLKHDLFQQEEKFVWGELENQNLDENEFESDYTKASRQYNTATCIKSLEQIKQNLKKYDIQSMMLLDAWGDVPSGILGYNGFDMGSYDECLNVSIEASSENVSATIKTQYCLMHFNNKNIPVIVGICIPESCSPRFFETISNSMTGVNKTLFRIPQNKCQMKDDYSKITTTDKVAIAIFTIILGLVVASTIYDGRCLTKKTEAKKTLLAFSVYNNSKKWLSFTKSNSEDIIQCMHGIRALSRIWNLVIHTLLSFHTVPTTNISKLKLSDMLVIAAPFATDSFFLLSGTLTSLTILKQLKRTHGKLNIASLYSHRILRLIPLLAATILFLVSLFRFFGNGPAWYTTTSLRTDCENNWWSTILHVQNYLHTNADGSHNVCISQSWYLAADFQLFLIAPYFVYLLRRYEWKMIFIAIIIVLCGIVVSISTWPTDASNPKNQTVSHMNVRCATHLRYSPYLIGIVLGLILFKNRGKKVNIAKTWNAIGWLISIGTIIVIIFGHYPFSQPDIYTEPIHFACFISISRIVWALAHSYIIFACHHGYGGPINTILSLSLWQPLSRLTYAIYITHYFVIQMTMATIRTPLYYSTVSLFYWSMCNYGVNVIIGLVFFLLFESPVYALEPHILAAFRISTK